MFGKNHRIQCLFCCLFVLILMRGNSFSTNHEPGARPLTTQLSFFCCYFSQKSPTKMHDSLKSIAARSTMMWLYMCFVSLSILFEQIIDCFCCCLVTFLFPKAIYLFILCTDSSNAFDRMRFSGTQKIGGSYSSRLSLSSLRF